MKTRMLYTSIWCDSYVRELSDTEARLFLFFLTNEKVNLSGIYQCPDFYTLSLFPQLNQDKLNKIKEKLAEDKKLLFCEDWVYITNAQKFNDFHKSAMTLKPLLKELTLIPLRVYSYFNDTLSIPYQYPIDTTIINYNNNHNKYTESEPKELEKKDTPLSPEQVQANMSKLGDVIRKATKKGVVNDA